MNKITNSAFSAEDRTTSGEKRTTPFETIALLLQEEVRSAPIRRAYQALAEAGLHPDWVAGISIGAINGRSSPATHPKNESIDYANFGRLSARPQLRTIILS
jgi:NTE family protein